MTLPCVNEGGASSRILLRELPRPEQDLDLDPAAAGALRRWRVRPGEIVTVVDPADRCWRARVLAVGERPRVRVFQPFARSPESPLELWVLQALPARERFELVLQKLTELGVDQILPYVSRRSLTLAERDAGQRKSHRWPEILRRAALQCRRASLPALYPVADWEQMLAFVRDAGRVLLLDEGEAATSLREAVLPAPAGPLALVVGPEGGFAPEEVESARGAGLVPVTLGGRLLRTETAAIVAAALLQHRLGDLG